MLPCLTREEERLVDLARQFAHSEIMPQAARWERERRIPRDVLAEAAQLGLGRIEIPVAQGGQGMSFFAKLRVTEELSRACMAFAFSLVNVQNCALRIAQSKRQNLIDRYLGPLLRCDRLGGSALTEPGVGSDFSAISTSAHRVEGGWLVNGEKAWITNAAQGDVFATYVQTDPAAQARGIACVLIDGTRAGFVRHQPYALSGGHAIGAGGFTLSNYFVADDEVLSEAPRAFKSALVSINGARSYVAAMACGMLDESIHCALTYGQSRHAFGQRLIDHQGLRWKLAKAANDLEAARLLCYRAAWAIDNQEPAMLYAAHAKKFASEMIVERLADCMQAMGANGLREEYPLGRHLTLARIVNYVDGTTEMQNERIAALMIEAAANSHDKV